MAGHLVRRQRRRSHPHGRRRCVLRRRQLRHGPGDGRQPRGPHEEPARGARRGLQHDQLHQADHQRGARSGSGRRPGVRSDVRHLRRREEGQADRRPYPPRTCRGRSCRHHLAASLRHGARQVPPDAVHDHHRRGGREDRARVAGGRRCGARLESDRDRVAAGRRATHRHPAHQVHDESLAAHGGPDLRCLARVRIPWLHRPRAEGRHGCHQGKARTGVPDAQRLLSGALRPGGPLLLW
ncbi:hypothetical protein VARIO8X_50511 [Burkholderiales bacterium 8X]|nr:hypothetical protein VARIO8X_50511 [Burkholderiales bacterium 8X]